MIISLTLKIVIQVYTDMWVQCRELCIVPNDCSSLKTSESIELMESIITYFLNIFKNTSIFFPVLSSSRGFI